MKKLVLSLSILLAFAHGGMAQQGSFAPQGAEWYFNVNPDMFFWLPVEYYQMEVLGDTIIQGHQCSVITPNYYSESGENEYVYEENRKVYWYNQVMDAFTTLYDFNAEVGDSWICEVGECSAEIRVYSIDEVTYQGLTFRVQNVEQIGGDYNYAGFNHIIEGIGSVEGLFPYSDVCFGIIYDGPSIDYLRCYLVDGQMLYHEGNYNCDYVSQPVNPCWDGTIAESYAGGDGTEENPYQIATPQQLALLAQQTHSNTGGDAHYILTNDICLNQENDTIDWLVIGKETQQNMPVYFRGVFDGNGHTIENMFIGENHVDAGLFGHTRGATIKNLTVVDSRVQTGGDIGIIVGQAYNTNIINCTVLNSTISCEGSFNRVAGGIVGGFYLADNYSDTVYIKDCVSEVSFMNPERYIIAGGIVGRYVPMTTGFAVIENCENRGDVAGDEYIGGIVGSTNAYPMAIKECRSHGSVTSSKYAGGIVGYFRDGTITGCLNQSEVTGGENGAGGIAGTADFATIESCTNQGEVSGDFAVGGIVGYGYGNSSSSLNVFDCVNEGTVTGHGTGQNLHVGGIIGFWGTNVIRCVNKGDVMGIVKSSGFVGGIVASCSDGGFVANCYNRGDVTATIDESVVNPDLLFVGGISATPDPRIYNVYNTGVVMGPELPASVIHNYGNIIGRGLEDSNYLNAYWLDDDDLSACGNVNEPELHGSTAFVPGATSTIWTLNEPQYGTTDLLEALNFGAAVVLDSVPSYPNLCTWLEDVDGTNDGYPVLEPLYQPGSGDSFQSGDLLYAIISTDPRCVSVTGHVDGENAQGELDIPSEVTYEDETYTVTEIGEWAFMNCAGLTDFMLPSTIDTIREGAFYGCSGFTGTLDLSFSTVVFKENVFRDCTGFTNLILPLFISEIPQGLFCGCSGLTGTLVLPETVEIIGEYAFAKCSGYTGLVLPNGLREIREQAFSGCTGFTGNLVFPETVTHIKYGAFHDCSGFFGDLVLPNSVVEVGHTTNPIFNNMPLPDLYTSAFADCFDHLVLSQSLETIGMYCFAGCTRLTGDLVMPSGLKAIKDYAFAGCTGFNSLTLNDSLLLIGRDAFMACNGITGTLTIPENISLGLGAFEMCEGIEELDLPHNITFTDSENIKGGVFYRCTGLTEVDIPEGWIKIEQSNFAYCSNLRRVHLPESLISIEDGAFLECTNLEEINIPEGVTGIKDASFALCRSLTHIELPSTLRTLGCAFQRCTSLTGDMVIPDLVQKVNAYTFDSCNMLNRIVLGDSINWIAEPAFDYTELTSLVLKTMTPPQLWCHESPNAWHLPVDIPIIVPCGALEAYQNDENWSGFTNITEDCGSGMPSFNGSEWYYEILNDDGSITYQHLQQSADTTVNDKTVTVIIRTNTLYDKGRHQEVTREYIYEEDNVVYWWNNELMEFTVLYDLGVQQGDSWVIKVGTGTLTMHVDAVEQYYYDGRLFKMLVVSDEQNLFSGTIVCGIGHLTSFFPERLMTRGEKYRVEGIRCYWREGDLVFKYGDRDCDEVYEQYHFGIEEDGPSTGSGTFAVYPNPTDGVLIVETVCTPSLPSQTYRVTNLTGQTVLTGSLNAETQQVDVSDLPQGMYFISVDDMTQKFVVR